MWTCDGWLFWRHPWRVGVGYILTHTRIISRTLTNFCLSFLYLWFSSKDYSFGEQSVVKQEAPKKKVDQRKVETINIDDSDDKNVSVFFLTFLLSTVYLQQARKLRISDQSQEPKKGQRPKTYFISSYRLWYCFTSIYLLFLSFSFSSFPYFKIWLFFILKTIYIIFNFTFLIKKVFLLLFK